MDELRAYVFAKCADGDCITRLTGSYNAISVSNAKTYALSLPYHSKSLSIGERTDRVLLTDGL